MDNFTTPTWKMIGDMQDEVKMLHAENALKLTQILDLETLVFQLKHWEMSDGSPCWCMEYENSDTHSPICAQARKATEPFWKPTNSKPILR